MYGDVREWVEERWYGSYGNSTTGGPVWIATKIAALAFSRALP